MTCWTPKLPSRYILSPTTALTLIGPGIVIVKGAKITWVLRTIYLRDSSSPGLAGNFLLRSEGQCGSRTSVHSSPLELKRFQYRRA